MRRPSIAFWLLLALPFRAHGLPPPPGSETAQGSACASDIPPYDRSLLKGAGYRFGSNAVYDLAGNALTCDAALALLEGLRDERRSQALAILADVQNHFLGKPGNDAGGTLSPDAAGEAQRELARDWELIPSDIRNGMNALLAAQGYQSVRSADLSAVQRAADSWGKADPGGGPALGQMPPGWSAAAAPGADSAALQAARLRFARPSPQEVSERLRQVESATYKDVESGQLKAYPEEIKQSLREIIRYAAREDGEAVLRVLRTAHPPIEISNSAVLSFDEGTTFTPARFPEPGTPKKERQERIALLEYVVLVPRKGKNDEYFDLPDSDPYFYRDFFDKNDGLPIRPVQALDPSESGRTEPYPNVIRETFPDGSQRRRRTPEGRADAMLHELMHADTFGLGAGANSFTSEMRSFLAQARFRYNRDEALDKVGQPGYRDHNLWLSHPISFREGILSEYLSPRMGEVEPDAVSVQQQMDRDKRTLEASPREFERLRTEAIARMAHSMTGRDRKAVGDLNEAGVLNWVAARRATRRINAGEAALRREYEAKFDYRRAIEWEQDRLAEDQALEIRVLQDDILWHTLHGLPYDRAPAAKSKGHD